MKTGNFIVAETPPALSNGNGNGQKPVSYKLMWQQAWRARSYVGLRASAVAGHLECFANSQGRDIFPGNEGLGRKIGKRGHPIHHRTIAAALEELLEAGWLVKVQDYSPRKGYAAEFALRIPPGECECPKTCYCHPAGLEPPWK